jgi:chromosome segregation ATPase
MLTREPHGPRPGARFEIIKVHQEEDPPIMCESDEGGWVIYDDYAALRDALEKSETAYTMIWDKLVSAQEESRRLRDALEKVTAERTKIQTDFHNWLADRDGNFYEQIKELVGHADALQQELAESQATVGRLEGALKSIVTASGQSASLMYTQILATARAALRATRETP